ncbi:methyltransferase domain-containing protein [Thermococcus bergensis]|uniref:class I SAM-dependent methyltransferase n=1 Tax=Thermococcus bergensis TaxID=2689387 RepID=UPI001CEDE5AA|nr:class I SAM-dependent methyltransferase [Thermococcus bergensis]MCA6214535.1 methyltransferase domain-containing protein [Thermococcus bergensis]
MNLEEILEEENLGIEVLHPGGLEITRELAELCGINEKSKVLDVACGTGETACFLAETFGCEVVGVDASPLMIEKAKNKAKMRGLEGKTTFILADAHKLPFPDNTFDVVISECTLCLLNKEVALREIVRVVKPNGYVGIHDVAWKEDTPETLKLKLKEIEGEEPETIEGWRRIFEKAGLMDVIVIDKSHLIPEWMKEMRKEVGIIGELKIFLKILRKEGLKGLKNAWESMKIFESPYTGYVIIVGRKPAR